MRLVRCDIASGAAGGFIGRQPVTGPSLAFSMDVVPSTPKLKRQQLTSDTRRDILLMRSLHHTYAEIAEHLKISESAAEYTYQQHKATPIKRRDRPSTLSSERVNEIEVYLRTSKQTRRLPYLFTPIFILYPLATRLRPI